MHGGCVRLLNRPNRFLACIGTLGKTAAILQRLQEIVFEDYQGCLKQQRPSKHS